MVWPIPYLPIGYNLWREEKDIIKDIIYKLPN